MLISPLFIDLNFFVSKICKSSFLGRVSLFWNATLFGILELHDLYQWQDARKVVMSIDRDTNEHFLCWDCNGKLILL